VNEEAIEVTLEEDEDREATLCCNIQHDLNGLQFFYSVN